MGDGHLAGELLGILIEEKGVKYSVAARNAVSISFLRSVIKGKQDITVDRLLEVLENLHMDFVEFAEIFDSKFGHADFSKDIPKAVADLEREISSAS